LQPGLTFVQPRTGFQVASVHSILDVAATGTTVIEIPALVNQPYFEALSGIGLNCDGGLPTNHVLIFPVSESTVPI